MSRLSLPSVPYHDEESFAAYIRGSDSQPEDEGAPGTDRARAPTNEKGDLVLDERAAPAAASATGDWAEPDMNILTEGRVPPPKLPLKLFGSWVDWIKTAGEVKSCPPDFIAVPLLAAAATLIGNARRAMAWPDWIEPCILWVALVGKPATAKSPALDAVLEPLRKIETELAASYPEALREHQGAVVAAKKRRDSWEKSVEDAVDGGSPPPEMPEDAVEPERPRRPRTLVTDTTIEEMGHLLAQNPHGIGYYGDELSGWLTNFERRGGNDRPFWIQAFGGRPYVIDRVKHDEPIFVPFNSVSIIGGLQPDPLAKLLTASDDDGLAARFLFTWPEPIPFERPTRTLNTQFALTAMRRLHGLGMGTDAEGNPIPITVAFSDEAADQLAKWRKGQAAREASASGLLLSHIGKMPGFVVRLSLVLTYLEWATNHNAPEPPTVIEERHALAAIGLVDAYFLPMARRCFGDASLPQVLRDAAAVAKWIVRPLDPENGEERLSIINAYYLRRREGAPVRDAPRMKAALDELEALGWVKYVGGREGDGGGKQRSDYEVNPKVFETVETSA